MNIIKHFILIVALGSLMPACGMELEKDLTYTLSQYAITDSQDADLARAIQESALEQAQEAHAVQIEITTVILPDIARFEEGIQRTVDRIVTDAEKGLLPQENVLKALELDRQARAGIAQIRAAAEDFHGAYLMSDYAKALTAHRQIIVIAQQLAVYKKKILALKAIKQQTTTPKTSAHGPAETFPRKRIGKTTQLLNRQRPNGTTDEFALPAALQHLPGTAIHYFRCNQQQAAQCGSRAVAGILAIQNLVHQGQPLTAQAIREEARKFDHILINRDLGGEEVWRLAQAQKVYHCHVLGCDANDIIYRNGSTGDFQEWEFPWVLQNIRGNDDVVAHFICNTGTKAGVIAHWVLVSVIKRQGQPSQIIYLNSTNAPLTNESRAVIYIRQLHQAIFG